MAKLVFWLATLLAILLAYKEQSLEKCSQGIGMLIHFLCLCSLLNFELKVADSIVLSNTVELLLNCNVPISMFTCYNLSLWKNERYSSSQ